MKSALNQRFYHNVLHPGNRMTRGRRDGRKKTVVASLPGSCQCLSSRATSVQVASLVVLVVRGEGCLWTKLAARKGRDHCGDGGVWAVMGLYREVLTGRPLDEIRLMRETKTGRGNARVVVACMGVFCVSVLFV